MRVSVMALLLSAFVTGCAPAVSGPGPPVTQVGSDTPAASPTPAPGSSQPSARTEVYAIVTAVDQAGAGSVTYDEIQWFWSPQAAQKCAEDGQDAVGAWCTDYYYRNANTRLRTAALAPGVVIKLLGPAPPPTPATLAQLAAAVGPRTDSYYSLVLLDGVVTELDQVYTP